MNGFVDSHWYDGKPIDATEQVRQGLAYIETRYGNAGTSVRLNPGEHRVRTVTIDGADHGIVVGRRIMFGRLVSCDCGWVDTFRHGRRRQERAAQRHLDNWTRYANRNTGRTS